MILFFVVATLVCTVNAFVPLGERRFSSRAMNLHARSWLENWLLPVVEGKRYRTKGELDAEIDALDPVVSKNFDDRFLDDSLEYENMQVASTMEEWLNSPAFASDRSEMRRRPPVWPGDRPPLPNFRRMAQSMDAAWGRGKFRREIWEDTMNPVTDWKVSFEPSEEEVDALFGPDPFWFNDVEGWCKEKGLEYEKTVEEWQKLREEGFQQYLKDEERKSKLVTQKEYLDYLELKERVEAQEFRVEDNKNQKYKGSMSLDDEDTGVRFWNDPIEPKKKK